MFFVRHVLIKFVDGFASNIVPISLPFFGEFSYEMLIGIDVLDLVAWLVVTRFAMGLVLRFWAGIGGANRVVVGVSSLLVRFFQMSMLIRKRARAIPIMAAGDVRCECPMCISWLDLV
jgi:hypothetical protein